MIKIEILDYIIYESFQKLETLCMIKEQCPPWRKARKLHEHRKETYIFKADKTRPPGHLSYGKIEI